MIVRLAGLPAEAMQPFASGLGRELDEVARLAGELAAARTDMVERLHAAIHDAPAGLRRFLLDVKRDCYNGRGLDRHRDSPLWGELLRREGALAGRILDLEGRLAERDEAFAAGYRRERLRERRQLAALLSDRGLLRGIALASPDLVSQAGRLERNPESAGRRERRLEIGLARYLSRAALKLSPYSTLTRLALASVGGPGAGGLRLSGESWRERSLLRLKRYLLEQWRGLLLRYRPFRDGLEVVLNDTLEEIAPGRYRWLRPGYWDLNPQNGAFHYHPDSLVTGGLDGELLSWLRRELPLPACRDLAAALERRLGQEKAVALSERLLRIGVLCCRWPWPSNECHLEERMLETLRALPPDGPLPELVRDLDRLVALEKGYPDAPDPVASVVEIERLIDGVWRGAALLGGLDPDIQHSRLTKGNLYEDVWLQPAAPDAQRRGIAQVPTAAVREVARSLDPWVRLASLFSHRHDFLHTMAGFMARQWPGREEVGLLELFGAAQPVWRGFMKLAMEARRSGPGQTLNPLDLADLEALRRLREEVRKEAGSCIRGEGEGQRISPQELSGVLAGVPGRYAPLAGACLFLQPAGGAGSLWVLNQMREGIGRFGSRFTPVMDAEARGAYIDRFTACSTLEVEGERAELLDLMGQNGDTLNVHAAQTPRVLEIPGERLDLPAGRKVLLSELRVRTGEGGPRLVDGRGRRILPVHLGGAGIDFMPTLLKFLSLFGPGELHTVMPERAFGEEREGVKVRARLTLGGVVLARRRWLCTPGPLVERLRDLADHEAFAEIHRWRAAAGLPDRAFALARGGRGGNVFPKPQYLDFTSPLLAAVFRSTLQSEPDLLIVEEMLPTAAMLPRDPAGRAWAAELLLDTLALAENRSARDRSPDPGILPLSTVTGEGHLNREPIPAH